jgi:hypothetical protein
MITTDANTCSFCGIAPDKVEVMIARRDMRPNASGDATRICSECVAVAASAIEDYRKEKRAEKARGRDSFTPVSLR